MNNKLFISHKNTHLRFYNFILSTKKSYSVFLISCICFFFSTNPLIAQSVSLNFNNASYEQIFNTIEQKTGYKFVYNTQEINKHSLRSITIKDKNIETVLNELFKNTDISYRISNKHIALFKQVTRKITGTVTDQTGEPIIGANVLVKGAKTGVITDFEGKFTLSVTDNSILIISYLGYVTQNVSVKGQTHFKITLKEDTQSLDEVVVVGYGVQKKRDLTGAISSVKMSDTPIGTFSTTAHALAGKAAGLQVTQSSAQVGGGAKFRIRGETSINAGNDPLFIIDGFPVSASSTLDSEKNFYKTGTIDNILSSINPNDIESIEVLKDASATAIYGSRAGHGVIIITTKRGKTGKAKVTYSGNLSVQTIKNNYKMLNGKQYRIHRNMYLYEKWLKETGQGIYADYITDTSSKTYTPRYTDEEIATAQTTDWLDEVTRTGMQQSHNVSLTGGSEKTQYAASLNYFTQKGVVKNNAMDRFTMKVNLDQELSKYIKTGFSLHLSRNQYDNSSLGDNDFENAGIISSALRFDPSVPVRDENGDYSIFPDMAQYPNPISLLEVTDKTTSDRVLVNGYLQAEPIKGLTLKANLGVDRRYDKNKSYVPNTTVAGAAKGGIANILQRDNIDYLMELTANYTKDFGNHSLTALVGYSYQQFNQESVYAGNEDFSTDGFLYNNLQAGAGTKPYVNSSARKSALGSYFARANYSYLGKYLLTVTVRADGESNFHPDYRWGYFPSVSAGWRFSDEEFMKPLSSILSNGKLRASYGQTGNSNIGNYMTDSYGVVSGWVFGNDGYMGTAITKRGNKKLTWETTSEFNIGLDLGFFDNRISLSMEYYNRIISDLLTSNKSLPAYNEINTIAANIGKTQGRGFELTLSTVNIMNKDWTWSTDFTFYTFKDNWYERDPNWKPAAYESKKDPIRSYYSYVSDGLLQVGEKAPAWQPTLVPGQIKLKNLYDTGTSPNVLDQYDKVNLGSQDPKCTLGLNNTLRYKNLDFNIYFYGEIGRLRGASYYDAWIVGLGNSLTNVSQQSLHSYTNANQNTTVPNLIESAYDFGDYYHKKINYLRCRNITLGYTIPVSKSIANSVRISANVSNPFVFTNWNGVDPETDTGNFSYPNVTSFSFGIDISF